MMNRRQRITINALLALLACNSRGVFAFPSTSSTIGTKKQSSASISSRTRIPSSSFLQQQNNEHRQHQRQQPFQLASAMSNEMSINGGAAETTPTFLRKRYLGLAAAFIALFLSINTRTAFLATALQMYESSLVTNPLPTKVVTGASLALMGDYLAQLKANQSCREDGICFLYDAPRAVSFALFDACYRMFQHVAIPAIVMAGTGKVFHAILSKLPFINPTMAFTAAMERTFLYQFLLIPFFYYPIFFTFTGFIQGLSAKETWERAKASFFPCWKKNLMFWIPTQMVMFGLIVERWQIPFVCVMGIIWSMILSAVAGKAKQE